MQACQVLFIFYAYFDPPNIDLLYLKPADMPRIFLNF